MQATGLYSRKARRISLTALIDVVFILLMFFMLTSTFSQWKSVDFQSPVASSQPSADKPDVIILGADGSLRTADESLQVGASEAVAANSFAADSVLVLVPEANATVQVIISRLEELKGLGLAVTMGGVTDVTVRGD